MMNYRAKALKRSLNCVSITYKSKDRYDLKFWNSDPFQVTKNRAAMPQNFVGVQLVRIPQKVCDVMGLNF